MPTELQLFSLSLPGRFWAMEGPIFVVVLGLLAIVARPSEAEEPFSGVSIIPDELARPRLDGDDEEGVTKPATPSRANLVSLFSTDDYPLEAIRNGEQGMVDVTLTVGVDGKVADCIVNQSSGSPSLDVQTCRILWTRARFTPALDANGKPVEDKFRQRIRWEMPAADPTEVAEQFMRHIVSVDARKTVVGCRYEASPDWKRENGMCALTSAELGGIVSSAPGWVEFAGKELVLEIQHRVGEPHSGPELGERAGESRLALSRHYLTIDPDGKVKSCSRDSWGSAEPSSFGFTCEAVTARWIFEELPAQETNRNDRQFTIVNAIYLRNASRPSLPNF